MTNRVTMIDRAIDWLRNGLAVVGLVTIGYCALSYRQTGSATVKAAGYGGDVEFQLTGVNETSSLLVYQPSAKAVYVYRGATVGNGTLQCSYKYVLSSPGEAIQRVNCPPGSAFPH